MVIGITRLDVPIYNLPQKAKLKGVKKIALIVAKAVRLIDNSVFPLARCEIKLEILPPGQAATSIIPNATLGVGFIIKTSKKVNNGRKKNCDIIPTNADFGLRITSLKLAGFISRATPNMINARVIFMKSKPPGLKFNLIPSSTCKNSIGLILNE